MLLGLAMNPEFMPPARGSQGVAKADWVAVWFWLMKVKTTMSPTFALIWSGTKTRPEGPPTVTLGAMLVKLAVGLRIIDLPGE